MLIPLGPLLWCVALAVVCAMVYSKHVATQQRALLALMAAAAERSMPLVPVIEAFARERGGWFGRRAGRVAAMLRDGAPLPAALACVPGVLPREAVPLVRVGYESGALAAALQQAGAARGEHEPLWQSLVPKIGYLCTVLWVAAYAVTFILWKIVPQYEKIFREFAMPLPPMTQVLIGAGRWFGGVGFALTWVFVLVTGVFVYILLRYAGAIHWDLPGTGWIVRRLDTAAVLDALSLAAAQERPLIPALVALSESYPKQPIRRRLGLVLGDVHAGADWCAALGRRGLLGRADLAVLQAAVRVGNLSWAMREMADSNRRRFTYRAHALVQVLFPPVILAFGVLVMFVVVALFLPLISLTWNLAKI